MKYGEGYRCIKGCGIHGIADIGFEGCKVKNSEGITELGVHVLIGGKATLEAREAGILKKSVPFGKLNELMKKLMIFYRDNKMPDESFESFETRLLADMTGEEIIRLI